MIVCSYTKAHTPPFPPQRGEITHRCSPWRPPSLSITSVLYLFALCRCPSQVHISICHLQSCPVHCLSWLNCVIVACRGGLPDAAMAVRGEALYEPRSAWFVCFPGTTAKDRLTNFRGPGREGGDELRLAERCLRIFTAIADHGVQSKPELMRAGSAARSAMRNNPAISDGDLMQLVLQSLDLAHVQSLSNHEDRPRSESPELQDCEGGRDTGMAVEHQRHHDHQINTASDEVRPVVTQDEKQPPMPPPMEPPHDTIASPAPTTGTAPTTTLQTAPPPAAESPVAPAPDSSSTPAPTEQASVSLSPASVDVKTEPTVKVEPSSPIASTIPQPVDPPRAYNTSRCRFCEGGRASCCSLYAYLCLENQENGKASWHISILGVVTASSPED